MNLRFGYNKETQYFFIQITQSRKHKVCTVFILTVIGIVNLVDVLKEYEKITVSFDTSLSMEQKQDIKDTIIKYIHL